MPGVIAQTVAGVFAPSSYSGLTRISMCFYEKAWIPVSEHEDEGCWWDSSNGGGCFLGNKKSPDKPGIFVVKLSCFNYFAAKVISQSVLQSTIE